MSDDSVPTTATDNRRWVCEEIVRDAERDVERFEGAPFTGPTVAEYMGCQAAAIAALAKIVATLLPAPDEPTAAEEVTATDPVAAAEIETINDCMVGTQAGTGEIVFPLPMLLAKPLPRDVALRMAGWVVAMADDSEGHADFLAVLAAVERT